MAFRTGSGSEACRCDRSGASPRSALMTPARVPNPTLAGCNPDLTSCSRGDSVTGLPELGACSPRPRMRPTRAVLRHIDLLVLATRYEELPSVLIGGMAAGLPVIASRVGGIPTLVDHDVNGLLVPPGDPGALAAAISRVLAEPSTAARLAAAARQTAQRYTWPALARQVAAAYLHVTGKRPI